ncbi:MAG: hypothetical protein KDC35_06580 [Acidobacteria bacterium]|nr:hypothetical protein [Acidobacteriota bacterium]
MNIQRYQITLVLLAGIFLAKQWVAELNYLHYIAWLGAGVLAFLTILAKEPKRSDLWHGFVSYFFVYFGLTALYQLTN